MSRASQQSDGFSTDMDLSGLIVIAGLVAFAFAVVGYTAAVRFGVVGEPALLVLG